MAFAAGLLLLTLGLALLAVPRTSVAAVACAAPLLGMGMGMGVGAALQAGSSVATQDIPEDVAAMSAAMNSTVRRLAGAIGVRSARSCWPRLLASLVVGTGQPGIAAYLIAYAVAGVLCLGGVVATLVVGSPTGRPRRLPHRAASHLPRRR